MIVIGSAIFLLGTLDIWLLRMAFFRFSLYDGDYCCDIGFGEVHTLDTRGGFLPLFLFSLASADCIYYYKRYQYNVEGHIHNYFKLKNMEHKIAQLEGTLFSADMEGGEECGRSSWSEKTPFVIIEKQESACEHLLQSGILWLREIVRR